MSNSEPSAIVLQGIPCRRGLYKFISNGENGSLKVRRDSPPGSRLEVSNSRGVADGRCVSKPMEPISARMLLLLL